MDIDEIIEESKVLKTRTIQFMIVVLIAGIVLAYFKTTTTETVFACACGVIAIFLYKKYSYICGFIEFLERTNKKDNYIP